MMSYDIPSEYTWNMKIPSYDAGQDRRLKLSSQLKLQQEVGELHLGGGGLGYEEFYNHGMTFVLTRLNSVIYRQPILNEAVRIRTWHRYAKGVQFFRCYQFLDDQGNALIESVTAFALVDIVDHKLLRPSVFEQFGVHEQPDKKNNCPDPGRWKIPQTLKAVGERLVHWSDTDYNGHLNNANYADIICDNIPGGMQGKRVTGFSIAYLHEALEGDCLMLHAGVEEEKDGFEAWVIGDNQKERSFEARVCYQKDE